MVRSNGNEWMAGEDLDAANWIWKAVVRAEGRRWWVIMLIVILWSSEAAWVECGRSKWRRRRRGRTKKRRWRTEKK